MKKAFRKNPILFIAILEVLFIIVLLLAMLTKKQTGYSYQAGDLAGLSDTIVRDMHLGFGSYEAVIGYHTDSEDATFQIGDNYYMDNAMTGDLFGTLDYTKDSVTVPFWLYHTTDELFVAWSGDVQIESIDIRSTSALFGEWILFFIILFLVVDFFVYRILRSASGSEKEVRKNKIIAVIAITAVVASIPLMINYLLDSRGDISFHLARIEGIYLGLKEGRFPVRMDGFMLNNQGYADPIFYPNLFLYIPAVFRLMGVPILRAYKLFIGLWNLFTCVLAYYSFKRIVKSDHDALTGMILYVLCPYRNLCLHGRGALGEALAMTFLPLVAAGLWVLLSECRQSRKKMSGKETALKESQAVGLSDNKETGLDGNDVNQKKVTEKSNSFVEGILFLALGLSGILQSHILSCEMTGIVMILVLLICAKRTFRIKTLLSLACSAVLTLLLNAWFLVPFLLSYEMPLYVFEKFDLYAYENALTLYHFFGVPLDFYGQSSILSDDLMDEMGMTLGWAILLGLLLIGFGIRTVVRYRKTEKGRLISLTFVLGLIASWITTYYFPWKQVENIPVIGKLLCMVQFPWRYLGIASFCFVMAVMAYLALRERVIRDSRDTETSIVKEPAETIQKHGNRVSIANSENKLIIYHIALIALTILLAYIHFHSLVDQTEYFAPYSEVGLNKGRTMIQAEYMYSDTTIDGLRQAARVDKPYHRNNLTLYFEILTPMGDSTEVATPLTYYPYYVAKDVSTGQHFDIMKGAAGTAIIYVPENYMGTIEMYLPEQKKWILGDLVSLFTLIGMVVFVIVKQRKRKTIKN